MNLYVEDSFILKETNLHVEDSYILEETNLSPRSFIRFVEKIMSLNFLLILYTLDGFVKFGLSKATFIKGWPVRPSRKKLLVRST